MLSAEPLNAVQRLLRFAMPLTDVNIDASAERFSLTQNAAIENEGRKWSK
jgi:hypothetical protein